jgi:hypothetical protein
LVSTQSIGRGRTTIRQLRMRDMRALGAVGFRNKNFLELI